jgi:hypothetical protein
MVPLWLGSETLMIATSFSTLSPTAFRDGFRAAPELIRVGSPHFGLF